MNDYYLFLYTNIPDCIIKI